MIDIVNNENERDLKGDLSDRQIIIAKMKKRMKASNEGRGLVEEVKHFSLDKKIIHRHRESNVLKSENEDLFEFLEKIHLGWRYSDFQIESMKAINRMLTNKVKERVAILQAPTASGKTLAFMIPPLLKSIRDNSCFIITYPRNALATDQLKTIIKYVIDVQKNFENKKISIGINYGGIGSIDKHVIDYINTNQLLESESFKGQIGLIFKKQKCPKCEVGSLFAPTSKDKIFSFKCTNDNCDVRDLNIYLSKDTIIKEKPNILISSFESLNSIYIRNEFSGILERTSCIILDEAHTYYSIFGSHIANFLSSLQSKYKNLRLILSSATIPNAEIFACKLTGIKEVIPIKPSQEDFQIFTSELKEKYYLIKSSDFRRRSQSASTLIQLLMLLGHSVNLDNSNGKDRIITFFDSRDSLFRQHKNFIDADKNRKLYEFRILKGKYLGEDYKEFKCPTNGEKNCNLTHCSQSGAYKLGECWYGLTKSTYKNGKLPKPDPLKTDTSISENPEYDLKSDIVFSTSTLELGIDDSEVTTIVQYRPTYTIFSFIQRKGRAGRSQDQQSEIYMVLSKEPSDRFYFNNLERMLQEEYILPLNRDNPYTKWTREVLDAIKEKYRNEYESPNYEKNYSGEYLALIRTLREVISKSLNEKIDTAIGATTIKTVMRKEYERKLNHRISELEKEREKEFESFKTNEDPFEKCRKLIGEALLLGDSSWSEVLAKTILLLNKLEIDINDKNVITKDVRNNIFKLLSDQISSDISNKTSVYVTKNILPLIVMLKEEKEDIIREKLGNIGRFTKEIMALKEVGSIFRYYEPIMIIRAIYRAWYYYLLSATRDEYLQEKQRIGNLFPKYLMPNSFFERGESIILSIDNEKESISMNDLINRNLPHRLVARYDNSQVRYVRTKLNMINYDVFDQDKNVKIIRAELNCEGIRQPYMEGDKLKFYLEPNEVKADLIDMSNDEENKFNVCKRCFSVASNNEITCRVCGMKVIEANLYAKPINEFYVETNNNSEKSEKIVYGIIKKNGNIRTLLTGEWVSITFLDENSEELKKRNAEITFETPIGKIIEKMIVLEINPSRLNNIEIEKYLNLLKSKFNSGDEICEAYIHSVAHLYIQAVSFLSGVSIEYINYFIRDDTIYLFENSETDTGVIDSFCDKLSLNPIEILEIFDVLTQCKTNSIDVDLADSGKNSQYLDMRWNNLRSRGIKDKKIQEISQIYSKAIQDGNGDDLKSIQEERDFEHIIECFDGCPDCLHLNNCSFKDDQIKVVSRILARLYTTKIRKEVAETEFKNLYGDKFVSEKGFIEEVKDGKVIWVEL